MLEEAGESRNPSGGHSGRSIVPLQAGDPLPDIVLADANGRPVELSNLRGGGTLILFLRPLGACPVESTCYRWSRRRDGWAFASRASRSQSPACSRASDASSVWTQTRSC